MDICQQSQTDLNKLKHKVNTLENLVKKQIENKKINVEDSRNHKNNIDWIEVYINLLFFFCLIFTLLINFI